MIIITTSVHQIFLDVLNEKGINYAYHPHADYELLFSIIGKAVGLVVSTQIKLDSKILDQAEQLKWVGRIGSGMDHIDIEYANAKNIICYSSPEGNRNAVGEFALGLMLSLLRNINKSAEEVKNKIWLRDENRGVELCGKTIGIIGFGNAGSSLAKKLSGFDVTILAYDKYKKNFGNNWVIESTLENITDDADIISFHIPLTTETKHFASNDFFESLKKKPYIINTSRGGVVDTQSLIKSIENKKISGAALDVLENERISQLNETEKEHFDFLANQTNVILTPHIAGYSFEASYKMSKVLLEKLGFI
jgi:D-3-phosphoglycerate dehydrogenase